MKKEIKASKLTALASGAVIIGAFGASANATELLNYESLGTGSELRSSLITVDALSAFTSNTDIEAKCGEGKCGEGKCGEKSDKKKEKKNENATMKASPKASPTATENTSKEKMSEGEVKKAEKSEKSEKPKGENPKD